MNVGEWLSALTWRDALDFFCLFIVVYGLLRAAKRTRAAPVLAAVVAFGAIAWAVRALDLIALATLLRYVFDSIIILLIVVFHQELRRLLVVLGQRLVPAGRRRAAASAVGELVSGLGRLQKARVGALVVLQGETDVLLAAKNRGLEIDAPLRADTIVALAIPHMANAAHDGALVIQEFRIARAGVICPLSDQPIDPSFGTRHRAGLGISEESDALVLVLSEESGELRIIYRGAISEALRVDDLEARITQWLETPRAEATRPAPEQAVQQDPAAAVLFERQVETSDTELSAIDLSRAAVLQGDGEGGRR
ncbi:MAG TPA: DNA integrity scanning protein DisA nucleotide-binding domain protein [Nannocystaceae bacterium]|nr:DNA integrity scanning protein DisA nucleotide-binding domain protein [Nannocystaceae bacterium]